MVKWIVVFFIQNLKNPDLVYNHKSVRRATSLVRGWSKTPLPISEKKINVVKFLTLRTISWLCCNGNSFIIIIIIYLYHISHYGLRSFKLLPSLLPSSLHIYIILSMCFSLISSVHVHTGSGVRSAFYKMSIGSFSQV